MRARIVFLLVVATAPSLLASGVVNPCTEGSLRAALNGGGIATFGCDGIVVLTDTLSIAQDTTLIANGHSVVISGSNRVRLFLVEPATRLELNGLILADGLAQGSLGVPGGSGPVAGPGGLGQGGAICLSNGQLRASHCVFTGNRAVGGDGGALSGGTIGSGGTGGVGRGGAIYSHLGEVHLENCVLVSNRASGGRGGMAIASSSGGGSAFGGAICTDGGTLMCEGTTCSNNVALGGRDIRLGTLAGSAPAWAGAIYTGGDAVISHSRLSANTAISEYLSPAGGGAIQHALGTLQLIASTLEDNQSLSGSGLRIGTPSGRAGASALGGGLLISGGHAAITNCSLIRNTARAGIAVPAGVGHGFGGGIYTRFGLELDNSTFHGNRAIGGEGLAAPNGSGEGGGLYNDAGSVTVTHVTFSDNAALKGSGGGLISTATNRGGAIASSNGSVRLRNSILANSLAGSNWFGSGLVEEGPNLSSDASCPLTAPGSRVNTDPRLGPIWNYGGPTATVALLADSPAIDAADAVWCPGSDQRGRTRPFGPGCDLGAFESSEPYSVLGRITGYLPPSPGVVITSLQGAAVADSVGRYAIPGIPAGNLLLTPTSPEAVFVGSNKLVQVSADVVGVDFHSYRSNALVIERVTGPALRGVFAGEAGATYQVLTSTNLPAWIPWSTNVAGTSGLIEFLSPGSPASVERFFKVIRP